MTDAGGVESPHTERLLADMADVLDRCVWSQSMTHESLVTYLIEESYELVEAIESGDAQAMLEELGDVLWQVVFHSEIAARTPGEEFTFDDVARVAHEKVVRRHPHVFGDESAPTLDDVFRVWSAAKANEKHSRTSALDGIPPHLPALALADKVIGRAERSGVLPAGESQPENPDAVADDESQLGDQLLEIVRAARARGLDAERALRGTVRRLSDEVREREKG
ncbi:MazG family protein [Paramicrobacterium agarici]|uniref:MazG family protein n=1 Tax=Paramicrobacterium agarici TaxID=630514 RepID=UPI0011675432|nr:MazG family protein [Microbacterium agarici]TQO21680.1 XTP/dITP diphosphohydrolase [Microbacterium agarici]